VTKQPVAALIDTLRQLETVVGALTAPQYAEPPEPLSHSSIGSHVRHCLDHVEAFLSAASSGVLDYDHRRRGTIVESEPLAALRKMRDLRSRLESLEMGALSRMVTVRALLDPSSPPIEAPSSLGRELAYVVSHTTHHNAIVGFLVRAVGGETPARFGFAASTLAHLAEAPCAR
jgi:uncharacterized damage-inducible protein DinB